VKLLSAVGKETQRGPHALFRLIRLNPLAFGSDAKRGQAKACGSNARHVAMVFIQRRVVGSRAVCNQSSPGISLLPKVLELAAFHVFKKYFVRWGKEILRAGPWRNCMGGERCALEDGAGEQQENSCAGQAARDNPRIKRKSL